MIKDFQGTELKQGNTVAIVYHPQAYEFSVEPAIIDGITGAKNRLLTHLTDTDIKASFYPDETGEIYRKIVKISSAFPKLEEGQVSDAVGHAIHLGDKVVYRRPSEAGGNTVKGFEKGGTVVKITDHFVFFSSEENPAEIKRKGFNTIVVC